MSRMTDQIGRVLSGRYRLIAPVGTGASAQVYLADDVKLRRRVAVKLLHPALADDESFLRRFRAEAQAAAALNHPHIVAVYDWGEDDGTPFLVTELLSGGSLRSVLDAGHRLSPSQALLVGLEAARALDVAHRRGFVHRDIKPANLLFGDDARLRVADFGLARAIAEAAWTEPQGAVLGTARYATPEQARGEAVDGRADVYSLALVLVEAVTGQVPFAADTTIATLMGRIGKDMVVPDELGPLRWCLERAGRADPTERPDAGELAVSLMAAAEQLPRPGPLPLVGLGDADVAAAGGADDPDRTVLGLAVGSAARPGGSTDEGSDATVVVPGPEAHAGPDGAPPSDDATVVVGPAGLDAGGGDQPERAEGLDDAGPAIAWVDSEPDEGAPPGRRRRRWPVLVLVVVLAAVLGGVGAFAYQQAQTPTYEVPVLTGLQEDAARRLVDENGWRIEVRQDREDDTVPGQVLRTEPVAGERLAEGGTLVLHVSLGNTLATLPGDLAGRPVEEAEAALEEVGLVPTRLDEHSEDVPAGVVISVPEDLPAQLPKGEEVELVVSAGPAPRTVPEDLAGQPLDAVRARLGELGLEASVTEAFSDSVERGLVVSVRGAGSQVERGATVEVVVSRGPDLVTVPDVAGRSLDEAVAALEAAGLTPGQVFGPAAGSVAFTDPDAGQTVRRGTVVDITLRRR
jgi:eukaryotic-like serine/threonine-protein kinase